MRISFTELRQRLREFGSAGDEMAVTRGKIIMENAANGIAANLAGGSFFTGLLLFLNASTIQIGLVNIIAYVCNILQLFAPLFLERFSSRKRMLVIVRILNHILNIVLIGLLSILPAAESFRVYMILGIQAILNIMGAFTSSGYSVWHIQSIPDRERAHYFSANQRICSTSAHLFILIGSAIADQFRGTEGELTGYLILRAIAIIFAVIDVWYLAQIKEYPYPKSEQKVSLLMLFTEPLKAKRYRVSILVIFLWNLLATTCGSYYTVYLLDTVKASYSFLNICSAMYVPCMLILMPIWARVINRTSWFAAYWKSVLIYGLFYFGYPLVTVTNYHWVYPIVLLALHILSPAINLVHSNLAFYKIPRENQTVYLSFYSTVANIAAILGNLFATQFMLRTEGMMFNILGINMHPGQLLPGITGLFIMSLGVIAFFLNKREERLDAIEAAENPPEEEDVFADTSV